MTETLDSLPSLHATVQNITSAVKHKEEELKITQTKLKDKINNVQSQKSLIILKSGYYMRMTTSNAKVDKRIAFMNGSSLPIEESVNSVSYFSKAKTDVNRFLLQIVKSIEQLPDILATLPTEKLKRATSFLPESIDPRVFLASSTFPSLFGFCWADELTKSYINFLSKIAKKLPPLTFDNFRSHWLFDCYKNFIHASSISRFLNPSLNEIMMKLINDKEIARLSSINDQTGLFNALIKYAGKMIKNMRDNAPLFPQDVNLLISSFADLAGDQQTRTKYVEMLFLDCILAPAISFPKTYSLLPPSYCMNLDAAGSSRSMQVLAQVFRLILHPAQAKLRYSHVDHEALSSLPFQDLLDTISAKNESITTGPKLAEMLPLIDSTSVPLLFSTLDVSMLSTLIINIPHCPSWAAQLILSASRIPTSQQNEIVYFRYQTWDLSSYGISSIDTKDVKLNKAPQTPVNLAASALMTFLSHVNIEGNQPDELGPFLDHQEQVALLREDFVTHTYLNNIVQKLIDVPEEEHDKIIPALKDEIRRNRKYISRLTNHINTISVKINEIEAICHWLNKQSIQLLPILLSNINELFISSNPEIVTEFNEKREQMLQNKQVFKDFLFKVERKIIEFLPESNHNVREGVAEHFHSWMMQQIPISDFIALHPEFANIDKQLLNVSAHIINSVCIQPSPPKIQALLQSPHLFIYVQQELAAAASIVLPAEAGRHVASAIALLSTIFELSIGGTPQADDMTPILNFSLLTSNIPNLLSFSSYIQQFYHEINQKEFKVVPDATAIAITHLVNHATSLDSVINSPM